MRLVQRAGGAVRDTAGARGAGKVVESPYHNGHGLNRFSGGYTMSSDAVRYEHDLLGDRAVPAHAYYGVHTLRALENFPITGTAISIYPELVSALACVKQAAALANNELGLLDDERTQAIPKACQEIRDGTLVEQFVV